jgi:hypothetical protein
MTGSTLANTNATPVQAPTDPRIALAINSLAAKQQALYEHIAPSSQQMAAISFNTQPPTPQSMLAPHSTPFNVPPIHQLSIPASPPFNAGGFNNGHGGRSTGGCGHGRIFHWCGQGCTPFVDHMAACGGGVQGGMGANNMFPQVGSFQTVHAQRMNLQYSNVTKKVNNCNVCYSCGFDVEDGHRSMTCPAHWRKPMHVKGFTRANAQSYIGTGYNACTKGMHKNVLPTNTAF